MREIKFRAWLPKKTVWADPEDWGKFHDLGLDSGFTLNEYFETLKKLGWVLTMYTGLKDKNGVEIYEGDILFCYEYDSSDCMHQIVQTFNNAVVGFDHGCFFYYPKGNMSQPHQLLMHGYKPQVIGNIFEHPELLKP